MTHILAFALLLEQAMSSCLSAGMNKWKRLSGRIVKCKCAVFPRGCSHRVYTFGLAALSLHTFSLSHWFYPRPLHNALPHHFSLVNLTRSHLCFFFLLFWFCAYVCLKGSHPGKLLGKSAKPVGRRGINRVEEGKGFQNKATAQHRSSTTSWKVETVWSEIWG